MVAFESSSGKGLETPRATQLAKMARRIKISNGLESYVKVNVILLEYHYIQHALFSKL